ncbi:MAG: hypothetical protein K6A40_08230 [Solobacterium sp.]|nr:hypothetical protein [Solobacterium sp.]
MKKTALIILTGILMTGCAGRKASLPEAKDGIIDLPGDISYAEITVSDTADTLQKLAEEADSVIFLGETDMHWWKAEGSLYDELRSDPAGTLGRALQISLLGHSFYEAYDDSRLAEGYIGIRFAPLREYALESPPLPEIREVRSLDLCADLLKGDRSSYTYMTLPVQHTVHRGYLLCENSEQLAYAAEYGYIPAAEENTPAYEILKKATGILSLFKGCTDSETELYSAVYRYVLQNVHYDYTTLMYMDARGRQNRVFYLEGALMDEHAVCDGMCKEILLLCRLAGIKAHHIGARNGDSGHAYLYVRCDGQWYLSCPTYGSLTAETKNGKRLDYHTMNYMLTDLDTNMDGWPYVSDALPEVREAVRDCEPYDSWSHTHISAEGREYTLHPESTEEALAVLHEAVRMQKELGIAVECELCGNADLLRKTYTALKEEGTDVMYFSGGTFAGQRLQIYVIGGNG